VAWDQVFVATAGLLLALAAVAVRAGVTVGRRAGGVDTWYYLAYADAFRARPSLDVRLPQYLLQDERQSYAPLFPSALALLPAVVRKRYYWLVSPAVDAVHLLVLYTVAYRLTGSLSVALATGVIFAITPQLVSETRSLNGRSFGILLHSLAMLATVRFSIGGGGPWLGLALVFGAALLLSSASASAAWAAVCAVLAFRFADPRYLLVLVGALALALVASGGHFARVVRNYVQALQYWRRHHAWFGAHPIRDSPLRDSPEHSAPAQQPGFLGGNALQQLLRLLGENPFILALPLAPAGVFPWGPRLHVWAVTLALLAVLATFLPPLRAFGPGRHWMRAGAFPTAFTLAAGIGSRDGFAKPLGVVTVAGAVLSLAAIAFYYWYLRHRVVEQTAFVPEGLAPAVEHLRGLPAGGIFCLPSVYADFTCYHSGQPVLWGGHCGDLTRFGEVFPVLRVPLAELFGRYGVRYVLIDGSYVRSGELAPGARLDELGAWGTFQLYEWRAP
jgi:hypothetical protein